MFFRKKGFLKGKLSVILSVIVFVIIWSIGGRVEAAEADKPTGLKQVYSSETSYEFEWNEVLDAEKYVIEVSKDNIEWKEEDDTYSTSAYISGVESGKKYWVRVRVEDTNEVSDPLQVVTSPKSVENLKQVAATTNSITLQWNKASGASKYIVFTDNGDYPVKVAQTTANKVVIKSNIKTGASNSFYVYAQSQSATGYVAESYKTYFFGAKTSPKKIKGLQANTWNLNTKQFSCRWNANSDVYGYQVQLYNRNKKAIKTETVYRNYGNFNKVAPTTYYYGRVRGFVTVDGVKMYGSWSDYTYFVPQAKIKTFKISGSTLKLTWNKVIGASGYDVYVSTTSSTKGYKKVKSVNAKTRTCNIKKVGKAKISKKKTYYVSILTKKKVGKKTIRAKQSFYNMLYYIFSYRN